MPLRSQTYVCKVSTIKTVGSMAKTGKKRLFYANIAYFAGQKSPIFTRSVPEEGIELESSNFDRRWLWLRVTTPCKSFIQITVACY